MESIDKMGWMGWTLFGFITPIILLLIWSGLKYLVLILLNIYNLEFDEDESIDDEDDEKTVQ